MRRESLTKAKSKVFETVKELDIDYLDKMELCMNLFKFLDEDNYQSNLDKLNGIQDRQISIADYIKTLKKEMKPDDRRKDTKKKNNTEEI